MTPRPQPRKSNLSATSPVDPPATEPAPRPVTQPESTPAAPAEPAPEGEKPRTKYRHKASFYQDPQDTDRVRSAIEYTKSTEDRAKSFSEFVSRTVMAEVERLETKYNDGKPFPHIGAGEMAQGRPMGS